MSEAVRGDVQGFKRTKSRFPSGMTDRKAKAVLRRSRQTADLSTPLRSGRDDKGWFATLAALVFAVAFLGHTKSRFPTGMTERKARDRLYLQLLFFLSFPQGICFCFLSARRTTRISGRPWDRRASPAARGRSTRLGQPKSRGRRRRERSSGHRRSRQRAAWP